MVGRLKQAKKKCPVDPDGLHRWVTYENYDKDGVLHKLVICSQCKNHP